MRGFEPVFIVFECHFMQSKGEPEGINPFGRDWIFDFGVNIQAEIILTIIDLNIRHIYFIVVNKIWMLEEDSP